MTEPHWVSWRLWCALDFVESDNWNHAAVHHTQQTTEALGHRAAAALIQAGLIAG